MGLFIFCFKEGETRVEYPVPFLDVLQAELGLKRSSSLRLGFLIGIVMIFFYRTIGNAALAIVKGYIKPVDVMEIKVFFGSL